MGRIRLCISRENSSSRDDRGRRLGMHLGLNLFSQPFLSKKEAESEVPFAEALCYWGSQAGGRGYSITPRPWRTTPRHRASGRQKSAVSVWGRRPPFRKVRQTLRPSPPGPSGKEGPATHGSRPVSSTEVWISWSLNVGLLDSGGAIMMSAGGGSPEQGALLRGCSLAARSTHLCGHGEKVMWAEPRPRPSLA